MSLQLWFKRWLAAINVHVRADPARLGAQGALNFESYQPGSNQIENLTDVEHYTHDGRPHHEVCEDGLLSGTRYVAVHQIRTGADITLDLPGQLEAVVDVV